MTDDTVLGDTVSNLAPREAGRSLRAAREAAGMSIEEVATKLKLSSRQIHAIEAEDWANLPERTFTRGFFYSYARLVGVDKKSIDSSFTARSIAPGEMRTLPAGISEVTHENTSASRPVAKWGIPAALLLCLVVGTVWLLWRDMPMPQATSKIPVAEVAKGTVTRNEQTVLSPQNNGPISTFSDSSTSAQILSNAPILGAKNDFSGNSSVNSPQPAATAAPGALIGATPPATTPLAAEAPISTASQTTTATTTAVRESGVSLKPGQKRVNIVVRGRSWMEIRGRGDLVASEMMTDATREFAVSPPIAFVIGNASNVKLTIDGKPHDFSTNVRNEVARFRVE
jgi:cytoskeleton protein RodZ